ncbi:MAG: S8/S53 family peptidase, partial [Gammaproteobacteria bacterium]
MIVLLSLLCALVELPLVAATGATIDTTLLHEIQADLAQQAGLKGQGVVIGVTSDGMNGYQTAQVTGDLPATIGMVGNDPGTGAEGTALMEVIHQIAPQATLAFCGQNIAPLSMGTQDSVCAQKLVQDFGAQVVADDAPSAGPPYAPSPDSYNYDQLLASDPALIGLNAAGNQQLSIFMGVFVPATLTIAGTPYQVEDYGKAAGQASNPYETVSLSAGQPIIAYLNSNQNVNNPAPSTNDVLGFWILSQSGTVLASGQSNAGHVLLIYTSSVAATVNIVAGIVTQNNTHPVALEEEVAGYDIPINGQGSAGDGLGPSAGVYSIGAMNEASKVMEAFSETGPVTVYY